MSSKVWDRVITCILLPALFTVPAFAAPFWPYVGMDGSTVQTWGFGTTGDGPLGIPPDEYWEYVGGDASFSDNPYGVPVLQVLGSNASYVNEYGLIEGPFGVWCTTDGFSIYLPNAPTSTNSKHIRVEILWEYMSSPGNAPEVYVSIPGAIPLGDYHEEQLGFGYGFWYLSTYDIQLPCNPDEETIYIDTNANVDYICVKTYCPEPGTMCVLTVGAAALLRRRRHCMR